MSDETKTGIVQTLKVDAADAAWRTAGSQFVKLVREPLAALLQRHLAPGDESMRARLAAFLETELGTAMLASLLSVGLGALPPVAGETPQKLARELRVKAMADAGDVMVDLLMGPMRQVAALYLQGAPAEAATTTGVRVAASNDTPGTHEIPVTYDRDVVSIDRKAVGR